MPTACILVVEDDADLREALCDTLELAGYGYMAAASAEAALERLSAQAVDMVITDVNMPGMDGHELLQHLRKQCPGLPVLLITAYGSIRHAVDAMRQGAVDYLVKPFQPQALVDTVKHCLQGGGDTAIDVDDENEVIAEAPVSKQLLQLARRVAATDSTVLISGESGTGKEVLARYLHRHSSRAGQPFVAINCAAIPESMLEAMLFGYEKGAFTGAYATTPGKFEQADGGTLLLDEVTEMDLGLQAKLLRVLQEQEVERLGGRKPIRLDVRVLATTNRDLAQAVAEQRFREDLYYRLNVFPLRCQPLRARREDIVPLARQLLTKHAIKMQRSNVTLHEAACLKLANHAWPGNVRELDNVIQRALIVSQGEWIGAEDLFFGDDAVPGALNKAGAVSGTSLADEVDSSQAGLEADLQRHELQVILETLRQVGGHKKQAAERLGISPRTLRYKLARMREQGFEVDMTSS